MSITVRQLADYLVAAYEELEGVFVRGSGMRSGTASAVVQLKAERALTAMMKKAEYDAKVKLGL